MTEHVDDDAWREVGDLDSVPPSASPSPSDESDATEPDSPECPEDGLPCSDCGPAYCWASYPEHVFRTEESVP